MSVSFFGGAPRKNVIFLLFAINKKNKHPSEHTLKRDTPECAHHESLIAPLDWHPRRCIRWLALAEAKRGERGRLVGRSIFGGPVATSAHFLKPGKDQSEPPAATK